MSAFELALVTLNLVIASIYAAILWVMVQQRRLMDKQLEAMQAQLREAERTRMAAHRPILRVEPPFFPSTIWTQPPPTDFYLISNIGLGAAIDVCCHIQAPDTGEIIYSVDLEPIGASETSKEVAIPRIPWNLHLVVTYSDIFGNRFWTLYKVVEQRQTLGEGNPPTIKEG